MKERIINAEMLQDGRIAQLSSCAFRLFIATIVLADDLGTLAWETKWLRVRVYRGHASDAEVEQAKAELEQAELVVPAYPVGGECYVHNTGAHLFETPDAPMVPADDKELN